MRLTVQYILLFVVCANIYGSIGYLPHRPHLVQRKHNTYHASSYDFANQNMFTTRSLHGGSTFAASTVFSDIPLTEKSVTRDDCIGKIVFLLPNESNIVSKFGSSSPVGNPTLFDAVQLLGKKATYFADGRIDYEVTTVNTAKKEENYQNLVDTEILIAIGLTESPDEMLFAEKVFQARRQQNRRTRKRMCHFALECAKVLPPLVGPFDAVSPSPIRAKLFPWTEYATASRMHDQMLDLFSRWTSDEFCYALMIFLNQFSGSEIDWVKYRTDASWEKGPIKSIQEIYSMVTECSDCILPCVRDDKCRECLSKLTAIDPRDQATSYRTLVSYESELLTKFSLCIFTKKNIFQCNAIIPTIPKVPPMTMWRGKNLTEEDGRALLVGHLNDPAAPEHSLRGDISWKVCCGANKAYDQFPSQNQLFYPAARGRDMWYDPVFRVETLDGRNVWCKRHYKVRPQSIPGTFRLSVSDNGVTSDEFWTIVGAADDLSWIVFHYAGAAKTVGLQYLGGLLCTPDGSVPDQTVLPQIWDCFRTAGIEPWELYMVDNRRDTPGAIDAGIAPLEYYRSAVLEKRGAAITA